MSTIDKVIRTLEEQLQETVDTAMRVDLLNSIAYEARHTDTALALQKSREAHALAERIAYQKGAATALLNRGFAEVVLANYASAYQTLMQAAGIFEVLQDEEGRARTFYNLGLVYRSIGDFTQALDAFQQSFALRQAMGDLSGQAVCNMQLGYLYMQSGNLQQARKHYSASLDVQRQLNDAAGVAAARMGMGVILQKLQQYPEAEAHLLESLAARRALGEIHGWLVSLHYLGEFYLEQNRPEQAEKYLTEALELTKQHSNPFPANFCRLCTCLAKLYIHGKRFDLADHYLQQALHNAEEANLKYLLYDIHLTRSDVFKQTGDFQSALASYEKYHRIKEETINLTASTKLKNLELLNQIETEKKEAEIHRLRHVELKEAYLQLKEAQSQLIQSEKMASLGELTAGIAHEIQNPLNFVNNFSEVSIELLQELREEMKNGQLNDALEEELLMLVEQNLNKIHYHGKRADSIVKNMLEHSRASGGEKRAIDLNALADEHLLLSYHGLRAKDKSFNAKLVTSFDQHLGRVEVIPQEIGLVLLNLFNNAFYATQQKLKQNGERYQPEVQVSTLRQQDYIQIKVRDNGTGIPSTVMKKIFQPFFTTKPTGYGTGLGLSLSYDIVTKSHGGELLVESVEGEYTEFNVHIPLAAVARVEVE
ncbi:hypothetical protein GCM10023188_05340 [Pontibacter saemangeumensis]|uniref:histidine kinase n=1 Tax=Pontibacter saemangeumensis TaxID=1084525 RepID=A0ABP8L9S9_9BACT